MRLDLASLSNCLLVCSNVRLNVRLSFVTRLLLLFCIFKFAAHFYFHLRKTAKNIDMLSHSLPLYLYLSLSLTHPLTLCLCLSQLPLSMPPLDLHIEYDDGIIETLAERCGKVTRVKCMHPAHSKSHDNNVENVNDNNRNNN